MVPRTASSTRRLTRRDRRAEGERIRQELSEFLDGSREWPSYREFQRAGRKGLRDRITKHGGARLWARRMGVRYLERRPGYPSIWTDERIRHELRAFLRGRDLWPSRHEFEHAGRKLLRDAVQRTGGPERWAGEFELPRRDERSGSRRVWTDDRIEAELRDFLRNRPEWPSRHEFLAGGRSRLLGAVYNRGGPNRWARRLGVRRTERSGAPPRWVWPEERIRSELIDFCAGREQWPRYREFVAADKDRLYKAASLRGGIDHWIEELGLIK